MPLPNPPEGTPDGAATPVAWLGAALALGSALAFAFNLTLVAVVYADGGNVHAVNLVRPLVFALALLLMLRWRGLPLGLPRGKRLASLAIGVLLCVEMYALLGAIRFIPVGLAVLIMYTYPMLVALLAVADGSETIGARRVTAMLVAFAGLALALDVTGGRLDWRGAGLGGITALAFAVMVHVSGRSMRGEDRRAVMLHAMLVTSLVVSAAALLGADLAWPASTRGWLALAGATVFFIVATFALFTAIGLIGALGTAIVDNTSPVWAILFAWLLLDERLSGMQLLGAGLVLGAVVYVQLREQRVPRPIPHP